MSCTNVGFVHAPLLSSSQAFRESTCRRRLPPVMAAPRRVSRRPRPAAEPKPTERKAERIQKAMSRAGVCSRREAEAMVAAGRVRVNGAVLKEQGFAVSRNDVVEVDEKVVMGGKGGAMTEAPWKPIWVAVHKPKGMLCTAADSSGRRTVVDVVPGGRSKNLAPVQKIEKASAGLVILTNEREQAFILSQPSCLHVREYLVDVVSMLNEGTLVNLRKGVPLKDEEYTTRPADVDVVDQGYIPAKDSKSGRSTACTRLSIRVRENRQRLIRRMFESLDLEILSMQFLAFGPVRLTSALKRGQFRSLTPNEVKALKRGVNVKGLK